MLPCLSVLPSGVEFDIPVPSSPALSEQCESISEEEAVPAAPLSPPDVVVGDEGPLGFRPHLGGRSLTGSGASTPLGGGFPKPGLSIIDDLQVSLRAGGEGKSSTGQDESSSRFPLFASDVHRTRTSLEPELPSLLLAPSSTLGPTPSSLRLNTLTSSRV